MNIMIDESDIIQSAIRAHDSTAQSRELTFRILAGTAWLDALDDSWYLQVDIDTLAMSACSSCVLGQVVGDYAAALWDSQAILPDGMRDKAEHRGFCISQSQAEAMGFEITGDGTYAQLTTGWRALIASRQGVQIEDT